MHVSELKTGDVLLYTDSTPSFGARGVRFFTGSAYTHCSIIIPGEQGSLVFEQLFTRTWTPAWDYQKELSEDETLQVVRPRFDLRLDCSVINNRTMYGFTCILDCLINHGIGQFQDNRVYKPYFSRIWGLDCSALVATVLGLDKQAEWCYDCRVVEPDDFWNHTETFEPLGELEW